MNFGPDASQDDNQWGNTPQQAGDVSNPPAPSDPKYMQQLLFTGTQQGVAPQFSQQEMVYYDNIFMQFNISKTGVLSPPEVSPLLKRTKLAPSALKLLWDTCDNKQQGCITRVQFYMLMRLVSMAQQGVKVLTWDSAAAYRGPPPQLATQVQPSAGHQVYVISEPEVKHYLDMFTKTDTNRDGFVTGHEARVIFMQSRLSMGDLRQIWVLADTTSRGMLDQLEFAIALCLINRKLKGHAVPSTLPDNLKTEVLHKQFGHLIPAVFAGAGAAPPQPAAESGTPAPAPAPGAPPAPAVVTSPPVVQTLHGGMVPIQVSAPVAAPEPAAAQAETEHAKEEGQRPQHKRMDSSMALRPSSSTHSITPLVGGDEDAGGPLAAGGVADVSFLGDPKAEEAAINKARKKAEKDERKMQNKLKKMEDKRKKELEKQMEEDQKKEKSAAKKKASEEKSELSVKDAKKKRKKGDSTESSSLDGSARYKVYDSLFDSEDAALSGDQGSGDASGSSLSEKSPSAGDGSSGTFGEAVAAAGGDVKAAGGGGALKAEQGELRGDADTVDSALLHTVKGKKNKKGKKGKGPLVEDGLPGRTPLGGKDADVDLDGVSAGMSLSGVAVTTTPQRAKGAGGSALSHGVTLMPTPPVVSQGARDMTDTIAQQLRGITGPAAEGIAGVAEDIRSTQRVLDETQGVLHGIEKRQNSELERLTKLRNRLAEKLGAQEKEIKRIELVIAQRESENDALVEEIGDLQVKLKDSATELGNSEARQEALRQQGQAYATIKRQLQSSVDVMAKRAADLDARVELSQSGIDAKFSECLMDVERSRELAIELASRAGTVIHTQRQRTEQIARSVAAGRTDIASAMELMTPYFTPYNNANATNDMTGSNISAVPFPHRSAAAGAVAAAGDARGAEAGAAGTEGPKEGPAATMQLQQPHPLAAATMPTFGPESGATAAGAPPTPPAEAASVSSAHSTPPPPPAALETAGGFGEVAPAAVSGNAPSGAFSVEIDPEHVFGVAEDEFPVFEPEGLEGEQGKKADSGDDVFALDDIDFTSNPMTGLKTDVSFSDLFKGTGASAPAATTGVSNVESTKPAAPSGLQFGESGDMFAAQIQGEEEPEEPQEVEPKEEEEEEEAMAEPSVEDDSGMRVITFEQAPQPQAAPQPEEVSFSDSGSDVVGDPALQVAETFSFPQMEVAANPLQAQPQEVAAVEQEEAEEEAEEEEAPVEEDDSKVLTKVEVEGGRPGTTSEEDAYDDDYEIDVDMEFDDLAITEHDLDAVPEAFGAAAPAAPAAAAPAKAAAAEAAWTDFGAEPNEQPAPAVVLPAAGGAAAAPAAGAAAGFESAFGDSDDWGASAAAAADTDPPAVTQTVTAPAGGGGGGAESMPVAAAAFGDSDADGWESFGQPDAAAAAAPAASFDDHKFPAFDDDGF